MKLGPFECGTFAARAIVSQLRTRVSVNHRLRILMTKQMTGLVGFARATGWYNSGAPFYMATASVLLPQQERVSRGNYAVAIVVVASASSTIARRHPLPSTREQYSLQ